ncbi:MAG: transcription antitermination factor NusB [Oscillospiraceae bacterium]|jgi:N utilization substance protein B|nr:transcription antitermination factor NusB [Oscillospiraceae bacterium]
MNRRKAREYAFLILFQKMFFANLTWEELAQKSIDNGYVEQDDFTDSLCELAAIHMEEIDSLMAPNSKNWDLNRISKVNITILRLAITEIKYMQDIPFKVSVNEALELAKKFATQEEVKFVNGVLAGVIIELKLG